VLQGKDYSLESHGDMRVFIRYFTSGFIATISHLVVLVILVEFCFVNPIVATAIGFIVAIFVNYYCQYHWTFSCSGPFALIFARYLGVTILMLLLSTMLFWILYANLTMPYLVIQTLITSIVFICNFSINRYFTFVYSNPK
jgi:putative flippase GtrA